MAGPIEQVGYIVPTPHQIQAPVVDLNLDKISNMMFRLDDQALEKQKLAQLKEKSDAENVLGWARLKEATRSGDEDRNLRAKELSAKLAYQNYLRQRQQEQDQALLALGKLKQGVSKYGSNAVDTILNADPFFKGVKNNALFNATLGDLALSNPLFALTNTPKVAESNVTELIKKSNETLGHLITGAQAENAKAKADRDTLLGKAPTTFLDENEVVKRQKYDEYFNKHLDWLGYKDPAVRTQILLDSNKLFNELEGKKKRPLTDAEKAAVLQRALTERSPWSYLPFTDIVPKFNKETANKVIEDSDLANSYTKIIDANNIVKTTQNNLNNYAEIQKALVDTNTAYQNAVKNNRFMDAQVANGKLNRLYGLLLEAAAGKDISEKIKAIKDAK